MVGHRSNLFRATLLMVAICTAGSAPAQEVAEPAAVVATFARICGSEASSIDSLESKARSDGWIAQPARVVSTATGQRLQGDAIPKFFRKADLILVLTRLDASGRDHLCSVAGPAEKPLTTRVLAEALSTQLQVGEPVIVADARGEKATWQISATRRLEAGVSRKSSLRTARISARNELPNFALQD